MYPVFISDVTYVRFVVLLVPRRKVHFVAEHVFSRKLKLIFWHPNGLLWYYMRPI